MSTQPRIVIVGGGFGGLRAAQALKRANAQVTLIDRSNHHLFQPLLYQVATAGLSPADIAAPIRSVLKGSKNTEVVMGEVVGVDAARRAVRLADGAEVPYDHLILATGANHSYFGHDEWAKHAPGLKSIVDATDVRRRILLAFEEAEREPDPERRKALLTFLLVGGGPTGVEMAGAIAELAHRALASDFRHIDPKAARVVLLEAGPRVLAAFPEKLAQRACASLERLGVEVRPGGRVSLVDADGVVVNGVRIAARTVIWTAGVVASPAAKWLGVQPDRAGRVRVLPDLTVPEHPEISVIGDTAYLEQDGKPLPGVAPTAMQQGTYAGRRLLKILRGEDPESIKPFHYVDKGNMATVGRSSAIVDLRGIHLWGPFAWLTWLVVHIFYLIGFRNRLLVVLQWAWAYATFQRGARLITFDPSAPPASPVIRKTG